MMAVYPGLVDGMDGVDGVGVVRLTGAYWRRKRLEARLIAAELAQVLAGGSGGERQMPTHEAAEMWFR